MDGCVGRCNPCARKHPAWPVRMCSPRAENDATHNKATVSAMAPLGHRNELRAVVVACRQAAHSPILPLPAIRSNNVPERTQLPLSAVECSGKGQAGLSCLSHSKHSTHHHQHRSNIICPVTHGAHGHHHAPGVGLGLFCCKTFSFRLHPRLRVCLLLCACKHRIHRSLGRELTNTLTRFLPNNETGLMATKPHTWTQMSFLHCVMFSSPLFRWFAWLVRIDRTFSLLSNTTTTRI